MTQYTSLAQVYDALTTDVEYEQWAVFAQKAFETYQLSPQLVLELACGTGNLTKCLAQAGYEMIAADLSPEMLSVAREKCEGLSCPPVFLCQDMRLLDLYGTVDAAVCCLDSLNYLTELRSLKQAFARVSLFMNPGGLFLFDMKTKAAFQSMAGVSCVEETEDWYCSWQYGYDRKSCLAEHQVDLFYRVEGERYERKTEFHLQRCYSREQIEQALRQAGFRLRRVCAGTRLQQARPDSPRLFFIAQKI